MTQLVLLGAFFLIIYFTMIRPQQKQQKQRNEMLTNLHKGDDIVTIGGIQGQIKAIQDDKIILKVAHDVNLTMLKSSVGQMISEPQEIIEEDSEEEALLEDDE